MTKNNEECNERIQEIQNNILALKKDIDELFKLAGLAEDSCVRLPPTDFGAFLIKQPISSRYSKALSKLAEEQTAPYNL